MHRCMWECCFVNRTKKIILFHEGNRELASGFLEKGLGIAVEMGI